MSILNKNMSIKICGVMSASWNKEFANVSGRPFHALVFRKNGSAQFTAKSNKAITYKGDVFYMPANLSYMADYTGKNEIIAIHFYSDINAPMENFTPVNPQISVLFEKISSVWIRLGEGYYFKALSIFSEILEILASEFFPAVGGKTALAFSEAVDYMEKNYTSPDFSVDKMVSLSFMSNTYFRKLFTLKYGLTPAKYVLLKRLTLAEKLLSSSNYTVSEVSGMCGFSDPKYFSRAVKKHYGTSPSKLSINI